ncbi:MAG: hypothetical protein NTU44_00745 [Bacteroidetes bacterium]|nr:hypothetical protein [Bacteroidota bacterium]
MFKYILSLFLIGILKLSICQAQLWPHIFSFQPGSYGQAVKEGYDKSYIITGNIMNGSSIVMGLIVKTDVNGNMLWYRKIGNPSFSTGLFSSSLTSENGLITTGYTDKFDTMGDVLIFKSDVCGNKEWCKIVNIPNQPNGGQGVLELANGNNVVLVESSGPGAFYNNVWLFCFDHYGNLLWQKVYCQNDPKFKGSIPFNLNLLRDSSLLITGLTYYKDSLVQNQNWLEPLLVKTDQVGNEIWAKPWTTNHNVFNGYILKSIESSHGNYYLPGVRYQIPPNNIMAPSILKSDTNGNPLGHFEILNHPTSEGVAATLNQISANELVTSYRYTDFSNVDHVATAKFDTIGNLLKDKELILNAEAIINSTITSDQKILMIAGHYFSGYQMYLYKLTFDLEYDSLDTHVYNYDSLCPNPVYADTIDLDCDLIVDVQQPLVNPEKGKLSISPNPARDFITITFPPFYSSWSLTSGTNVQTTWYTYPKTMMLEIVDMMGRLVYKQVTDDNQKEIRVDVSGFPGGMMMVRLLGKGKLLTSGKFIRE